MDCRSGAVGGGVRLGGNDEQVPKGFVAPNELVLEQEGDARPSEELAELSQSVADEWEEAHRRYVATRESPVIHSASDSEAASNLATPPPHPPTQFPLITPLLHAEPERCSPGTLPALPLP